MSQYQGVVLNTDEKTNRAEIIIFPFPEGIPNASAHVNKIACHTPTEGSIIKIEANNNEVRAKKGDLVLVKYSGHFLKNTLFLIIIPLFFGIMAFILKGFFHAIVIFLICMGGGFLLYRLRSKQEPEPRILRVIKKKDETPQCFLINDKKNILSGCKDCPLIYK